MASCAHESDDEASAIDAVHEQPVAVNMQLPVVRQPTFELMVTVTSLEHARVMAFEHIEYVIQPVHVVMLALEVLDITQEPHRVVELIHCR